MKPGKSPFQFLLAALAALAVLAFSGAVHAAPAGLLLGINEGTSGSDSYLDMQDKYKPLARYLSTQLKRPVTVESARSLSSLDYNLKNKRYDLVLIRPSHIAAQAMRDEGYRLVAAAKGDAVTEFIVRADSPLKNPADLKGKKIALPDEQAYPTRVALAMLRDQGIQPNQNTLTYYRQQEAVGHDVQQKAQDVGVVVSYSKVAKNWAAQGGRILWQSPALPFWSVSASPKVDDATLSAAKTALLSLNKTPAGTAILKDIGVEDFIAGAQAPYLTMLKWVGN
jgi:ABC-type phosphate/phosphonate transport system substrate-binding protein